jgi:hypothetical protein
MVCFEPASIRSPSSVPLASLVSVFARNCRSVCSCLFEAEICAISCEKVERVEKGHRTDTAILGDLSLLRRTSTVNPYVQTSNTATELPALFDECEATAS